MAAGEETAVATDICAGLGVDRAVGCISSCVGLESVCERQPVRIPTNASIRLPYLCRRAATALSSSRSTMGWHPTTMAPIYQRVGTSLSVTHETTRFSMVCAYTSHLY